MANVFGLPIILSIGLGILFPYVAFRLMPVGFILLFLLMFVAGVTIDWSNLRIKTILSVPVISGLGLLYVVFPVCQWFLASHLVSDEQYLHGLILASLCPVAIVAPFFCRITDSDSEIAFVMVALSMLLFPFIAPVMTRILLSPNQEFDPEPIARLMFLLVLIPLILGYLTCRFLPMVKTVCDRYSALLNMSLLSLLIFILFGAAARRLNFNYLPLDDLAAILLMVFIQNFAVLIIARLICRTYFSQSLAISLAISLSMKNYAIAAGLLMFYDPRASLAASMGFVAHAFLFNFISLFRKTSFFQSNGNG